MVRPLIVVSINPLKHTRGLDALSECILFRKEHEKDAYCPKYKASRFLEVDSGDGQPKK